MLQGTVAKWEATRKADWTTTFTLCKRDSDGIVSEASFDDLKDVVAASCCVLVPAGSVFMSVEQANLHFAKKNALLRERDDAVAERDKLKAELDSTKSELAHLRAKTQDCMGGCHCVQELTKERDEWKEKCSNASAVLAATRNERDKAEAAAKCVENIENGGWIKVTQQDADKLWPILKCFAETGRLPLPKETEQ